MFADLTCLASKTAKMQPSKEHLPGLLELNTIEMGKFYSVLRRFAGNSSLKFPRRAIIALKLFSLFRLITVND